MPQDSARASGQAAVRRWSWGWDLGQERRGYKPVACPKGKCLASPGAALGAGPDRAGRRVQSTQSLPEHRVSMTLPSHAASHLVDATSL